MIGRRISFILIALVLVTVASSARADDNSETNQDTKESFLNNIFIRGAASGDFPRDYSLFRKGGYEAGLGYTVFKTSDSDHQLKISIQASFLDFGKQPNGILNINRVINIDAGIDLQLWRNLGGFILAGVSDADFGHNGDLPSEAGYSYKAHNGFSGFNAGVGLSYQAVKSIFIYIEKGFYRFHQIDRFNNDPRGDMENNGNLTLGLRIYL